MECIYKYTRAQAIADGYQYKVDDLVKDLSKEAGIIYPVFITASVKEIIYESLNYGCNDLEGVLWDIFTMFKLKAKNTQESFLNFEVFINWKNNKPNKFKFWAEIGATDFDNAEPSITIMTDEDL